MLQRLIHEEDGQTLIEYGFLAILVGTIAVAILTVIGRKNSDRMVPVQSGMYTSG